MIKKMVLAWDPDFTKVTPAEAKAMEAAEQSAVKLIVKYTSDYSGLRK